MSFPSWLDDFTEEIGATRLAGKATRQEAVIALRDAIAENADEALMLAIYAEFAARQLDAYHRQHQHAAPAPAVSHLQMELFPDLKPRLYIRPGVTKPVMSFTGHDWDNAREMIQNRTRGAIEFAEADWKRFETAYSRVRPLLNGDATTADVARELRGEVPLEGMA